MIQSMPRDSAEKVEAMYIAPTWGALLFHATEMFVEYLQRCTSPSSSSACPSSLIRSLRCDGSLLRQGQREELNSSGPSMNKLTIALRAFVAPGGQPPVFQQQQQHFLAEAEFVAKLRPVATLCEEVVLTIPYLDSLLFTAQHRAQWKGEWPTNLRIISASSALRSEGGRTQQQQPPSSSLGESVQLTLVGIFQPLPIRVRGIEEEVQRAIASKRLPPSLVQVFFPLALSLPHSTVTVLFNGVAQCVTRGGKNSHCFQCSDKMAKGASSLSPQRQVHLLQSHLEATVEAFFPRLLGNGWSVSSLLPLPSISVPVPPISTPTVPVVVSALAVHLSTRLSSFPRQLTGTGPTVLWYDGQSTYLQRAHEPSQSTMGIVCGGAAGQGLPPRGQQTHSQHQSSPLIDRLSASMESINAFHSGEEQVVVLALRLPSEFSPSATENAVKAVVERCEQMCGVPAVPRRMATARHHHSTPVAMACTATQSSSIGSTRAVTQLQQNPAARQALAINSTTVLGGSWNGIQTQSTVATPLAVMSSTCALRSVFGTQHLRIPSLASSSLVLQALTTSSIFRQPRSVSSNSQHTQRCVNARNVPIVPVSREMVLSSRVVGQWDNKFVLCLSRSPLPADGALRQKQGAPSTTRPPVLWVFDQHAVHERIRLEAFVPHIRSFVEAHSCCTSTGDPPFLIGEELSAVLCSRPAVVTVLASWGWSFRFRQEGLRAGTSATESLEGVADAVEVRTVPKILLEGFTYVMDSLTDLRSAMEECLAVVGTAGGARGESLFVPSVIHEQLVSRSCRGAIMFGDPLSMTQCQQLLGRVGSAQQYSVCSHGRPSMSQLLELNQRTVGVSALPLPPPPPLSSYSSALKPQQHVRSRRRLPRFL